MKTKTVKKMMAIVMGTLLMLCLAACGNEPQTADGGATNTENMESRGSLDAIRQESGDEQEQTDSYAEPAQDGTNHAEGRHILIAYFSVPEDVDTSGVDAVAGASIVVKDNEIYGNTEYVAKVIQETAGGDLFRIETTAEYPRDHDPLVDQAADEQDENARPELKNHIEDLGQYDTVILGFPNWWADLPMPVYTFLEEYDLSGKTIIPFVTHGGSGFSDTRDTISELEPDAAVSDNTLSLSRGDVADSEEEIRQWAKSLR